MRFGTYPIFLCVPGVLCGQELDRFKLPLGMR
jgi:hypothetical protein